MKNNPVRGIKLNVILLCLVLLLLLSTSLFMSGCEPGGRLTIENQNIQEVRIILTHVYPDGTLGVPTYEITISANKTSELRMTFLGDDWIDRLEAIDPSGKVVFSHDYKMADLEKMGWKIVILP